MAKDRFTEEEHIKVGQELTRIYSEIQELKTQVGEAYPYSSKFYKSFDRTLTALLEIRNQGDNESAKEYPQPPWSPRWYFGKTDAIE